MQLPISRQKIWYTLLAISTALRVIVAPFTGHPYDMGIWMASGRYVAAGTSPYLAHPHIGYPPLWALWCGVAYSLSNYIAKGNEFLYIFTIKIPIIIADIVLAMLLVIAASKYRASSGKDNGQVLAVSFLFNPYVLFVGVIWGMMDNLVAILLVTSLILLTSRPTWSGVSASLAVALKLYPILFLPLLLILSARTRQFDNLAKWGLAFLTTSVVTIWLPFVLFHWSISGFVGVGVAQVARDFGAIAPMATFQHLENLGVTSIGAVPLQDIIAASWLKLIWVPALTITLLLITWKRPSVESIPNMIRDCLLVYVIYLLTASWISEQLMELGLVLMLFLAAYVGFSRSMYLPYVVGSLIVFLYLTFNVPITSFAFPLYSIDPVPLASVGRVVFPWLTLIFGCFLVAEIIITARTFTHR